MATPTSSPAPGLQPLQVEILDAASEFPEPVWQLLQPATFVPYDSEDRPIKVEARDRAAVQAALLDLLRRDLARLVVQPEKRSTTSPVVSPEQWEDLLGDEATWRPRSTVCVDTTETGEEALNMEWTRLRLWP